MLSRLFSIWDFNNDGSIDRAELLVGLEHYCKTKMIKLRQHDVERLVSEVDKDGNNELNRTEFGYFMLAFSNFVGDPIMHILFFLATFLAQSRKETGVAALGATKKMKCLDDHVYCESKTTKEKSKKKKKKKPEKEPKKKSSKSDKEQKSKKKSVTQS